MLRVLWGIGSGRVRVRLGETPGGFHQVIQVVHRCDVRVRIGVDQIRLINLAVLRLFQSLSSFLKGILEIRDCLQVRSAFLLSLRF